MGFLDFFQPKPNGPGMSQEEAVSINASDSLEGVALQYKWISSQYGTRGIDWDFKGSSLSGGKGRNYDIMTIRTGGKRVEVWFDVTSYFGKIPSKESMDKIFGPK